MKTALSVILIVTLIPICAAFARTWTIYSNGSGDAPTIQAGIDSASAGDTLSIVSGTYQEHDIQFKSGIMVMAVASDPIHTVIDAQGLGRVLIFDGVDATAEIRYITFKNGHASGSGIDGCGGGAFFTNSSAPKIRQCLFYGNVADNRGGGAYIEDHSVPVFDFGVFRENSAGVGGGGVACASNSTPILNLMVFTGNTTGGDGGSAHCSGDATPLFRSIDFLNSGAAGYGGGLYSETGSIPHLDRCNVVFSVDGEAVYADDDQSIPTLSCCDVYGNQGGDWVGRIASQDSTVGNFSLDPLYCDTTDVVGNRSMLVESCSPCLYGNHPYTTCGSQVGYVSSGCDCGEATEPSTWGTIKALYR